MYINGMNLVFLDPDTPYPKIVETRSGRRPFTRNDPLLQCLPRTLSPAVGSLDSGGSASRPTGDDGLPRVLRFLPNFIETLLRL